MPGLLDAAPVDLTQAARRLEDLRARGPKLFLFAMALVAVGLVTLLEGHPNLGIPLMVGAGAALLLAWMAVSDRRHLLVRLVAQGDAQTVDGVAELANRLCSAPERRRLAQGLRAAADAGRPNSHSVVMVDPARASDVADRLFALADAIADPGRSVTSMAVALGRSLLIDPMRSPLYNPNLPERELIRVLDVIERGVEGRLAGGGGNHA